MEFQSLNQQLIRRALTRQALNFAQLDDVTSELARRMLSRLDFIKLQPQRILECGYGVMSDGPQLSARFSQAQIISNNLILPQLRAKQAARSKWQRWLGRDKSPLLVGAAATQLPFASQSFDLVYANMVLPYLGDPQPFIRELRRVLTLGGGFCISGLGVDSLQELRALGLTTFNFPDMHDIGDLLLAAGFSNPVVDTEYIKLSYSELARALADIKIVGAGTALAAPPLGRSYYQQLQQRLSSATTMTLEMYVAHGWKDKVHLDLAAGQSVINFQPRQS